MFELSVLNSYFLFDGDLFQQRDGVGMGLPLGPTFASIFICYYEKIRLDRCPTTFKPKYYRRYVDDFFIFDDASQIDRFLQYLNGCHPKIRFTSEVETSGSLPFLDVNVRRAGDRFVTSVYSRVGHFCNLFFISAPRAFFGVMALSDHKYRFQKLI